MHTIGIIKMPELKEKWVLASKGEYYIQAMFREEELNKLWVTIGEKTVYKAVDGNLADVPNSDIEGIISSLKQGEYADREMSLHSLFPHLSKTLGDTSDEYTQAIYKLELQCNSSLANSVDPKSLPKQRALSRDTHQRISGLIDGIKYGYYLAKEEEASG